LHTHLHVPGEIPGDMSNGIGGSYNDQFFDLQPLLCGSQGSHAAEGMPDGSFKGAIFFLKKMDGFNEEGHHADLPGSLSVGGGVKADNGISLFHQGFGHDGQLGSAATPAVYQQDLF